MSFELYPSVRSALLRVFSESGFSGFPSAGNKNWLSTGVARSSLTISIAWRLRSERHEVLLFHFHVGPGNPPLGAVQVEVLALRLSQLKGPHKHQRRQFQRQLSESASAVRSMARSNPPTWVGWVREA